MKPEIVLAVLTLIPVASWSQFVAGPPTVRPPTPDPRETLNRALGTNLPVGASGVVGWPRLSTSQTANVGLQAEQDRAKARNLRIEADNLELSGGKVTAVGSRLKFERNGKTIEDPVRIVRGRTVLLAGGAPADWAEIWSARVLGPVEGGLLIVSNDSLFRLVNHPDEARLRRGETIAGWFRRTGEQSIHTSCLSRLKKVQVVNVLDYGGLPPAFEAKAALEPLQAATRQSVQRLRNEARELEERAGRPYGAPSVGSGRTQ